MTAAVLDACAILAYLRQEPGAEVVDALLDDPDTVCYVHAVNLVEIYYDAVRRLGARAGRAILKELSDEGIMTRRDMGATFLRQVGDIKALVRISLADSFCIALAHTMRADLYTSDHHEFDRLLPMNLCSIQFIR